MKSITIKYGVDQITKQVEAGLTFGDLQEHDSIKAALGFGDNVKTLVGGIEQNDEDIIPANAEVRIETAANEKA